MIHSLGLDGIGMFRCIRKDTPHTTLPPPPISTDFAHEKSVKSLIAKYRRLVVYAGLFLYISRFVAACPQILCLELPKESQDPPNSCSSSELGEH